MATSSSDPTPSKAIAQWNSRKFGCILASCQVAFIVLFAVFVDYDWDALPLSKRFPPNHGKDGIWGDRSNTTHVTRQAQGLGPEDLRLQEKYPLRDFYSMYGDIQVMIFCAFGLLIACFKRYGYSSVSIAFLLAAFVVQWTTLVHGFFNIFEGKIKFSLITLISADFAIAAVLISTCVILGTISPLQYLILASFEVFFYSLNEWISLKLLKVVDVGGSIYLHLFAAYFGLAVSLVLHQPKAVVENFGKLKFGSKWNELLAMVGTLFLFIYWPSFNSVFAPRDLQNRAVLNTAVSLLASSIAAFAASAMFSRDKFSMTIVQNGALAGGVAIGATADLMIQPFGALIIGFAAGSIAVFGFLYISPILDEKLKLIDMCGVQYLHGLPGVLAGLISALVCALATEEVYGSSFWEAFPAMVPTSESPDFAELQEQYPSIQPGNGRTALTQAGYQILTILVSMFISAVSGLLCGFILRMKFTDPLKPADMLDDEYLWQTPNELTSEEQSDIKEILAKLGRIVAGKREISRNTSIKDQLKGLEACLKSTNDSQS